MATARPARATVERVQAALEDSKRPLSMSDLTRNTGFTRPTIYKALTRIDHVKDESYYPPVYTLA